MNGTTSEHQPVPRGTRLALVSWTLPIPWPANEIPIRHVPSAIASPILLTQESNWIQCITKFPKDLIIFFDKNQLKIHSKYKPQPRDQRYRYLPVIDRRHGLSLAVKEEAADPDVVGVVVGDLRLEEAAPELRIHSRLLPLRFLPLLLHQLPSLSLSRSLLPTKIEIERAR